MYLVKPEIFKQFLDNEKVKQELQNKPNRIPCIIEFRRNQVILAKVEVMDYIEFEKVVKSQKVKTPTINKYWVRGKEWEKDAKGNYIEELKI